MPKFVLPKLVFVDHDHPRCLTEALGAADENRGTCPDCDRAGAADGVQS